MTPSMDRQEQKVRPVQKVEMDGMTSLDSPPPAPSFITSTPNSLDASSSFSFPSVKKTPSVKKASMYAWLSLQQLSEVNRYLLTKIFNIQYFVLFATYCCMKYGLI